MPTSEKTMNPIKSNEYYTAMQIDPTRKQNFIGFFGILLRVAKRNPELWQQICNEENDGNKD